MKWEFVKTHMADGKINLLVRNPETNQWELSQESMETLEYLLPEGLVGEVKFDAAIAVLENAGWELIPNEHVMDVDLVFRRLLQS